MKLLFTPSHFYMNNFAGKVLLIFFCVTLLGLSRAKADYTVASGASVNASTITGQSGVLTINGTLYVDQGTVNLLNFTSVIVNAPNGKIYWNGNNYLNFAGGISFVISTGAPGLQPTGGNAATRLYIGSVLIAVSNDNSNTAAFSFADFNAAGGLPQFTLTSTPSTPATICYGSSFTATLTPLNSTVFYKCDWTIDKPGTITPATSTNFNTARTATITPTTNPGSATTYTVTCTIYKNGDNNAFTSKTVSVTVNPAPAAPTVLSATPASICVSSSSAIKATSAGNVIEWFTAGSGGTSLGTSASGANFSVTPSATTTYYAAAKINSTGCLSTTRSSVAVTVSAAPVGGAVSGAANICAGSNTATLTLNSYSGTIVRWESSTDNFATAPSTISNTSNTLTVNNLAATTYYRAVVSRGACGSANSSATVLTVSNAGTWLGVNTDWNSSLNWCNGTIPTASTNVVIPNGLSFYPVINAVSSVNNITVATGGSANIIVSGTFKIAGTISSTNSINATSGTIELIGATTQTISATNFTNNVISNLKLSNTLSGASVVNPSAAIAAAGGILKITGTVSFGNVNNAVLKTNDNLTLVSSATATAGIADLTNNNINNGNSISGKAIIERYIPARRSWRLLTAPVTSASMVKISDAWQEGALRIPSASAPITVANNPNPGYGTHITYGSPAAAGYDQGVNGNTSIKYLTATGWNGVPTATNNGAVGNSGIITDQPGYFLFVRGDRGIHLSQATSASPVSTVLRVKGNLNIGDQPVTIKPGMISGASHFRVIGNPYASAINFHKIMQNSTNVNAGFADAFYMWDATIGGTSGTGGWVVMSYNTALGRYEKNIGGTSVDSSGNVQSGSAILIDYSGTATNLVIRESDKVNGSNNSMFRPVGNNTNSSLRTSLLLKNVNGTTDIADAALVSFNEDFSNDYDRFDVRKISNFSENISVENNSNMFSIERRKPFNDVDTVAFRLSTLKQRNYTLKLDPVNIVLPQETIALLEDSFTHTKTSIDLKGSTSYDFTVNANAASSNSKRFKLLLQPFTKFITSNAAADKADIAITWQTAIEYSNHHFEVERSADGTNYSKVGSINSNGNSDSSVVYQWTDVSPKPGFYYYRVKAISNSGAILYSDTMQAELINARDGMYVYPNPVENNIIQLRLNAQPTGVYDVQLISNAGKLIHTQQIKYAGGNATQLIKPAQDLISGTYFLRISENNKKTTNLKIVVLKH